MPIEKRGQRVHATKLTSFLVPRPCKGPEQIRAPDSFVLQAKPHAIIAAFLIYKDKAARKRDIPPPRFL